MDDAVVGAVEHLVRAIVTEPDAVAVSSSSGRRGGVIRVSVAPADLGRVIGRGGRTATALRTVVRAIGDPEMRLDIIDADK